MTGARPEYGAIYYKLNDQYYHTEALTSNLSREVSRNTWIDILKTVPEGAEILGRGHSHQYGPYPSPADYVGVKEGNLDIIGMSTDLSVYTYNKINTTVTSSLKYDLPYPADHAEHVSKGGFTQIDPGDYDWPDYVPLTNSLFSSGGASGGYVLYPNKPNTNMMRAVYAK
jgi:hypothetical protein